MYKYILFLTAAILLNINIMQAQWQYSGGNNNPNTLIKYNGKLFAGGVDGIYMLEDTSAAWIHCGYMRWVSTMCTIDSFIFVGTFQHENLFPYIYRSVDGTNWSIPYFHYMGVRCMAASDSTLYAAMTEGMGIYRSTDEGVSWYKCPDTITNRQSSSLLVLGEKVYAGTTTGVIVSSDNGINWDTAGLSAQQVYSLASDGKDLLAGTNKGLFKFTSSWKDLSSNYSGQTFLTVYAYNKVLYAGAMDSVYPYYNVIYSMNNGTNWIEINEGLGNVYPYQFIDYGNYLFITTTIGVYRYTLINDVQDEEKSIAYSLAQNFPNPFNPITTINYSIAKEGNVKLSIYNVIGSKVATIVDEYKPAGSYSVQFNGVNLASGIYLYRLESGDFNEARKLILLK